MAKLAKSIRQVINEQKEQMQQDVRSILDGLDERAIDNVCQVIVDRCNIIRDELPALPEDSQTIDKKE